MVMLGTSSAWYASRPPVARPLSRPSHDSIADSTCRAMIPALQLTVLGIPNVIPVCSLVPGCPVVAAGPRAPVRGLSGTDRGRKAAMRFDG